MNSKRTFSVRTAPSGFVLLAVLVFILLLSMLVVSLMFRSKADEGAVEASKGAEQAWLAAMSGLEAAIRTAVATTNGMVEWQDNPTLFRDRLVAEDGRDQWYFTVYSPTGSGETVEIRYGLVDEASRINLNHPGRADLSRIPRVTASMVQALRQFTGSDGSPVTLTENPIADSLDLTVPEGGESLSVDDGIDSNSDSHSFDEFGPIQNGMARRGLLATSEEAVQVPGFSRALWYGEDANLNGHLDANEDDGDEQYPPDDHDGRLDHGLSQYFTVNSWDPELDSSGNSRLDLNDPKVAIPPTGLPDGFPNFIKHLRDSKRKLNDPADLLGATLETKDEAGGVLHMESGILPEHLPKVLDLFATGLEKRHDGLINLNTASAAVLSALPGIDPPLAEAIVSARTGMAPERRTTIAWLLQDGLLEVDRFKAVAPSLTSRSYQFHFFVLGYGIPSGRFCVVEASIDVAGRAPVVTYLRDLTRLGLPFRPGMGETNGPASSSERASNSLQGHPRMKEVLHG